VSGRRIVIVGTGVVGAALADELAMRGERDVTVLDKGPLFVTGGSSSHAPGLISRTSPSRFMQATADYTIEKYAGLATDEGPALVPVGTLEVAYTDDRLRELWRRHDVARSWGWRGRMLEPDQARERWPILRAEGLLGAYATDGEGLAAARRAVQAQAERAQAGGVTFRGGVNVTGFATGDGHLTGVVTDDGTVRADVAVVCAGVWGPLLARTVGLTLPMLAMEHQYAITTPIDELAANAEAWATMPILRHHDGAIYYRDHGDRVGIVSFHHRGLPVQPEDLDTHPRNGGGLNYAFTEEDWSDAWKVSVDLLPALDGAGLTERFNGVFGFTPDGYPLMGEHPELAGLWFAESVWVTHSAGVARALAERIVEGGAWIDDSPGDLARFDEHELTRAVFEARCDDQYRDVYVAHHPVEPHTSARGLRWSPFADAQRELGAVFFDAATWERPQWFEANAGLLDGVRVPDRDAWSSAHWSPVAIAEHLAVRARGGVFDMTPLPRIEVTGAGAERFLLRMVAARCDGPVGSVRYSVLLDEGGGIRSDVTVARFAEDRFVIGANGPRDPAWLHGHAGRGDDVEIDLVTDQRACLGVWGPLARDVLQPATDDDLSDAAFPYLSARPIQIGGIPVEAVRISYAGELGWELTSSAEDGRALWDAVWPAASEAGMVAAGRAALGSLRIEKGYRAWGSDITPEYGPEESGLGFTVRRDDSDFLGRDGLSSRPPADRRLRCLVLEGTQPMMGGEPLLVDDEVVGYVTSAAWGPSVGESIAYAWIAAAIDEEGLRVSYLSRSFPARIVSEPRVDAGGARLRA